MRLGFGPELLGVVVAAIVLAACHTMPWFAVLYGPTEWDPTGVCQLVRDDAGFYTTYDCPDGGHGPTPAGCDRSEHVQ